jgi:hypothetical protein
MKRSIVAFAALLVLGMWTPASPQVAGGCIWRGASGRTPLEKTPHISPSDCAAACAVSDVGVQGGSLPCKGWNFSVVYGPGRGSCSLLTWHDDSPAVAQPSHNTLCSGGPLPPASLLPPPPPVSGRPTGPTIYKTWPPRSQTPRVARPRVYPPRIRVLRTPRIYTPRIATPRVYPPRIRVSRTPRIYTPRGRINRGGMRGGMRGGGRLH